MRMIKATRPPRAILIIRPVERPLGLATGRLDLEISFRYSRLFIVSLYHTYG